MGVAEEAMITSVVEYGWRSLLFPGWRIERKSSSTIEMCSHD